MENRAWRSGLLALVASYGSAGAQPPEGTYRIWPVRTDPVLQAYYTYDTLDDVPGLTSQVGGPALITAFGGSTAIPLGPGLLYWNPVTNVFKQYRLFPSGTQFSMDLNTSAPSAGYPALGGGDVWGSAVAGASPFVHIRGTHIFRRWGGVSGDSMGIRFNHANGRVYLADRSGLIFELDPGTNNVRAWATGNRPYFLVADGRYVYATAAAGGGYPDQVLRLDVVSDTLTRWTVPGGGFYGANVVGVFNGLARDADGQLWFTETLSDEIGRLDPATGVFREYARPEARLPEGIATTGAGAALQVFFAAHNSNAVGILTPLLAPAALTTVVAPSEETIAPSVRIVHPDEITVTPVITTIEPQVSSSPRVDPEGLALFPIMSGTVSGPAGLSRIAFEQTVYGSLIQGGGVFQFTAPAVLPEPQGTANGRGAIAYGDGAATFEFNVRRTEAGGAVSGTFKYENHATGDHVVALTIETLSFDGGRATFGGTCTNQGSPCTFTVTAEDNGPPRLDRFSIAGAGLVPAAGTPSGGNIQVHAAQ